MKLIILTILVALALASCETYNQKVMSPTAKAAADQIETYCQARKHNPYRRCEWIKEVNKHHDTSNMTPLDCDGDGNSDVVCE